MAEFFEVETRTGSHVIYCVAAGSNGGRARREIDRVADKGKVRRITREAAFGASAGSAAPKPGDAIGATRVA